MTRPLVYLAGPYTNPDPVHNTHNTIKHATRLYESGLYVPVVPHLSLLWHLVEPRPIDFWYQYDLAILARCDAVYRLQGPSVGADAEVKAAIAAHIPVFYEPHEELLEEWCYKFTRNPRWADKVDRA